MNLDRNDVGGYKGYRLTVKSILAPDGGMETPHIAVAMPEDESETDISAGTFRFPFLYSRRGAFLRDMIDFVVDNPGHHTAKEWDTLFDKSRKADYPDVSYLNRLQLIEEIALAFGVPHDQPDH